MARAGIWRGFCFCPRALGSCGPGKLTEKGKFPKVLRGGCKRSFGAREQRSPKSLLHHPKPLLHRCKMGFGWCKRLFGDLCSLAPKDLLHPPLSTFGNFPFSVNFPGPQLPNSSPQNCRHKQKFWKRLHFLHQILVCTKPSFKRILSYDRSANIVNSLKPFRDSGMFRCSGDHCGANFQIER